MSHVEDYKNSISKRKKDRIEKAATQILGSLLEREDADNTDDDTLVDVAIVLAAELVNQMDDKYTVLVE